LYVVFNTLKNLLAPGMSGINHGREVTAPMAQAKQFEKTKPMLKWII
jgi:hypothetical protein